MDSDRTIGRTNVHDNNNDHTTTQQQSQSTDPSVSRRNVPLNTTNTTNADDAADATQPPPVTTASSPNSTSTTTTTTTTAITTTTATIFQWPTSSEYYELSQRIGQGAFASVWKATIKGKRRNDGRDVRGGNAANAANAANATNATATANEEEEGKEEIECAIKIMDLEHVNINISDIRLEVQTMRLSSHPNILVCHTSFVRDTDLWLVTQLMSKGSSLHCLQSARAKLLANAAAASASSTPSATAHNNPTIYTSDDSILEGGLTAHSSIIAPESLLFEAHITYALHETLLGLKYIHDNGQIHRDIKAGNLLLDGDANVRIADFGVSSWLIDSGNRREHATTFVGTPCWMAPEVMEQVDGYDYKADIWSLGITALELCKGYAPYAKFAPMKVLLLTIQEDSPSLETYDDGDDVNMWSKSFRSMVRLCLQKDPRKRPTCQDLLAHRHFKPLATAEGRARWRERTRAELCGEVEDVGKVRTGEAGSAGGGFRGGGGHLPGATPIQIVSTQKKDRPAGTSWILPGGSQVEASSSLKSGGADDGQGDFYTQFERQTAGENFNRERVHEADNQLKEKKEDEDDMNDFFDEFEKTTGGENFRRKA